jgi:peptide/nickel transport system substrate-binding protein
MHASLGSSSAHSAGSARSTRTRLLLALATLAALAFSIAADGASGRLVAAPTLVVDNSFALDTADPQHAFDPTSTIVDRAIYDTLSTYRGDDLAHPTPLLVRSWTMTNASTYTFRLKTNVHFADGTPLTAADVVFSLRRLANLKGNPSFLVAGLKVSAVDKHTIVIRSATPDPQLLAVLANISTGIVNAKLVRSMAAATPATPRGRTARRTGSTRRHPPEPGAGLTSSSPTTRPHRSCSARIRTTGA